VYTAVAYASPLYHRLQMVQALTDRDARELATSNYHPILNITVLRGVPDIRLISRPTKAEIIRISRYLSLRPCLKRAVNYYRNPLLF
jgi:hypothetical protein